MLGISLGWAPEAYFYRIICREMKRVLSAWLAGAIAATLLVSGAWADTTAGSAPTSAAAPESAQPSPDIQLRAESYPQALPNDGRSQAEIKVQLQRDGRPVAGERVTAQVMQGGGQLQTTEVLTGDDGVAHFKYRAGMMPEAGMINFALPEKPVSAELKIPLAPVTYIDVELVTPEEYKARMARRTAAMPIYKLEVTGFPEQLAADGGSMSTIFANLATADGKPVPGLPLSVQLVSGDGQLIADQKKTDSAGNMKFYFIAGMKPGTVTIKVTELSTGLSQVFDILLVEAGPARIELLYYNQFAPGLASEGACLPADGFTGLPLVAKVTNLMGLPLSGVELKIEALDNNGFLEILDPVSDAAGLVEFTYYSGTSTGRVRLRAYAAAGMRYPDQNTGVMSLIPLMPGPPPLEPAPAVPAPAAPVKP